MPARGIKENILKRLEELDELLFLSGLHNKEQLRAVVVGGAALLLMGYIDRSTKDIDFIEVSREAEKFLPEFDINTNVTAYLNDFPDDYDKRLVARGSSNRWKEDKILRHIARRHRHRKGGFLQGH